MTNLKMKSLGEGGGDALVLFDGGHVFKFAGRGVKIIKREKEMASKKKNLLKVVILGDSK